MVVRKNTKKGITRSTQPNGSPAILMTPTCIAAAIRAKTIKRNLGDMVDEFPLKGKALKLKGGGNGGLDQTTVL